MTTLAWNLKTVLVVLSPLYMRVKHESWTAVISSLLLSDFGNISKLGDKGS